jgi:hypothetical protein
MAGAEVSILLKYAYLNEAVLATGLAYLALEATRYPARVATLARSQIANLEATTQPAVLAPLRKTNEWQRLTTYAEFVDRKASARAKGEDDKQFFSDGIADWAYKSLFRRQWDVKAVLLSCFLTALFLVGTTYFEVTCSYFVWCKHPLLFLDLTIFFGQQAPLYTILVFCIMGALPPIFVTFGRYLISRAEQEIRSTTSAITSVRAAFSIDPSVTADTIRKRNEAYSSVEIALRALDDRQG